MAHVTSLPRHPVSQGSFPQPSDGEGKHPVSTTPELPGVGLCGFCFRTVTLISQRAASASLLFSLTGQQEGLDTHLVPGISVTSSVGNIFLETPPAV